MYNQLIRGTGLRCGALVTLLFCFCTMALPVSSSELDAHLRGAATKGGIMVYVGDPGADLDPLLERSDRFLVQILCNDEKGTQSARQSIRKKGSYGQITAEGWSSKTLPYDDDLINLIISDGTIDIPDAEYMRVLCPGGTLFLRAGKTYSKRNKPFPTDTDQWTHQWYGPNGNLVSRDKRVDEPTGMRWLIGPSFALPAPTRRDHKGIVTANGRIFYISTNDPSNFFLQERQAFLFARDAFNGHLLWKRKWDGPGGALGLTNLRLVAGRNQLFISFKDHVAALDPATGKEVRKYPVEGVSQKILHMPPMLLIESEKGMTSYTAKTGKRNWHYATKGVPTTVKARKPRQQFRYDTRGIVGTMVFEKNAYSLEHFEDAKGKRNELVCVNLNDGKENWRKNLQEAKSLADRHSIHIIFAQKECVGILDHELLTVLSTEDGRELWSRKTGASAKWMTMQRFVGHFYKDGAVWMRMVDTAHESDSQESWLVLDSVTGKVKREFKSKGTWPRSMTPGKVGCQPIVATPRYMIYPRQGTLISFKDGSKHHNNFFRGACMAGIVPANGLLYSPAHNCACFSELALGFMAVKSSPGEAQKLVVKPEERLTKGPAYGTPPAAVSGNAEAWPVFRHDGGRSGCSATKVAATVQPIWEQRLASPRKLCTDHEWKMRVGNIVTTASVADGKAFVAVPNENRIVALEAQSGKESWTFVAAGRVDTPPTLAQGYCVFGARDGAVYCLRASDGKLAWRYLAAPNDRRITAHGQLESVWPVGGSVIVRDGIVYASAGRVPDADGGVFACGVDLKTGQQIWHKRVKGGTLGANDVLMANGKSLYMLSKKIDMKTGAMQDVEDRKVFLWGGKMGMLEASWTKVRSCLRRNFQSWSYAGVAGQMLVYSDDGVFAYRIAKSKSTIRFHPNPTAKGQKGWTVTVPATAQVEAMVLTKDALFVAGPVDRSDRTGKKGFLWGLSRKDGSKLSTIETPAPPVWDGMAAADGRLFLSTEDGRVQCLGQAEAQPKREMVSER